MPATRITIALNTEQSQKAPLLVPASTSANPEDAKSICTGQELLSEADWKNNIKNDVVLLVSARENFVGVRRESGVQANTNPSCPFEVLAPNVSIESLAIRQLSTTAHSLPGIIYTVGQPDFHSGTKFPIGAVFASQSWIHPPLIGSDIGCGMAWYKTTLSRNRVDGDKGKKVAEKLRGLEGLWRTQAHQEAWLQDTDGKALTSKDPSCLEHNEAILLVHSGSRGYGGSILKKYSSEAHTSFEESSTEGIDYMKEHDVVCRWAKANRGLIALRFLLCLEPGTKTGKEGDPDVSAVQQTLQGRKMVDIWHNNVEHVKWPPSPLDVEAPSSSELTEVASKLTMTDHADQQGHVWIHRKGAAPTYNPETHLPLDFLSLAGSRALSSLPSKYKGQNILEPRAGDVGGTWVICDEKELAWEEAPAAYKDVELVGQDLVDTGVASIVGRCRARVSYKVRKEAC
ncbi:tRNA-splicing ligase [Phaeosphaeriaceae sp. PMI808]|nr:tRNA-splicing ligase [Phaeosphaeriaceae sp. PMI808]